MNRRQKDILKAIVERYIGTAEPVGSKAISDSIRLSSATIRNEMAELTEHGMLASPHTSAGRIPTTAAYRVYVDELMRRHKLTVDETEELNRVLRERVSELENILAYAARVISSYVNLPAYAAAEVRKSVVLTRFDLIEVDSSSFIIVVMTSDGEVKNRLIKTTYKIPEGMIPKCASVFNASFTGINEAQITSAKINAAARAVDDTLGITASIADFALEILTETAIPESLVTGHARILSYPEFHDIEKARRLLDYLSQDELQSSLPLPAPDESVRITIGSENAAEPLRESGVVIARRAIGEGRDIVIGVVGPERMDYPNISSKLEFLAERIVSDTG